MPSYIQTGKRTCPKCKEERTEKACKACGTKTRSSGNWSVRFYYKIGGENVLKRLSGFETKNEAEGAYLNFKNTQAGKDNYSRLKFKQLIASYESYQSSRVRETTMITYKQDIAKYITPYFADKDVFKFKKADVLNWQQQISAVKIKNSENTLSVARKQKAYERLISLLNHGVEFFDLPANVAKQVGGFRDANQIKKEMLFWSESEFSSFIKCVDEPDYKTLFTFLYLTGTRKGEALAIAWDDIDFTNKRVKINKSACFKNKNEAFTITPPKNFSSNRVIYLPDTLINQLNEHKAHCAENENFNDKCFVFGITRPLPPETIRRKFNLYCDMAKVKRIRIHDLRHSHASLLINKHQNILAVAQRLGHSNIEQTLNTYAHLMPDEQIKLVEAINISI